jgi:hypothetical protein
MDISLFFRRSRLFQNLSQTMEKLQHHRSNSKPSPETLKITRGLVMVSLALLFGWIGKSTTEADTRNQILMGEWPNPSVLTDVLKQKGWIPKDMADRDALTKALPSHLIEKPGIWTTEDQCTVFINQSNPKTYASDTDTLQLWVCAGMSMKSRGKSTWKWLGSGYDGVNQLARIKPSILKKSASYIDPNEIRY